MTAKKRVLKHWVVMGGLVLGGGGIALAGIPTIGVHVTGVVQAPGEAGGAVDASHLSVEETLARSRQMQSQMTATEGASRCCKSAPRPRRTWSSSIAWPTSSSSCMATSQSATRRVRRSRPRSRVTMTARAPQLRAPDDRASEGAHPRDRGRRLRRRRRELRGGHPRRRRDRSERAQRRPDHSAGELRPGLISSPRVFLGVVGESSAVAVPRSPARQCRPCGDHGANNRNIGCNNCGLSNTLALSLVDSPSIIS